MNLSEYIKRRNGVPMGASHSLRNMLYRSFGAGNFSAFWKYWNPIWSYFLGKYIFKPLKFIFPSTLALIITFVVCGFVHDLIIMLVKWKFTLLLTLWFLFMGFCANLGDYLKIDYSKFPWILRGVINALIISICLLLAYSVKI